MEAGEAEQVSATPGSREDLSRDSVRGRTVGRAARGHIIRGQLRSPDGRTMSSIPAKFETILNNSDRPAAAFLSSAPRFGALDIDMPGPGTYKTPSSIKVASDSFSKKGYGGLTSQTTRFAGKKAGARRKVPGPGAYDLQGRVPESQKDFNKAPVTSAFARVEKLPEPGTIERILVPGPGTYTAAESNSLKFHSERVTSMAFKSGVDRFSTHLSTVAPPPGAYESGTSFPSGSSEVTNAAFRNSGRYGGPNVRRTHAHAADASAATALKELQKHELPTDLYHTVEVDGFGRRLPAGIAHSFFAPTETDRFGDPVSPRAKHVPVPGPGSYDLQNLHPPTRSTSGVRSGFVSRSPRILEDVKTQTVLRNFSPPGPAFYAPEVVGKQSHRRTGAVWGL